MKKILMDISGGKYGRFRVIRRNFPNYRGSAMWRCICECGEIRIVNGCSLRSGNSSSCGCLKREKISKSHLKHGFNTRRLRTPIIKKTYDAWIEMKRRCYNDKCANFKNYGGRGILVCDRWKQNFNNFLSDMGKPPSLSHSLDRIDNNGIYEPKNCKWSTRMQQNSNTRRNRFITIDGQTFHVMEWSRRSGIPESKIRRRLNRAIREKDLLLK